MSKEKGQAVYGRVSSVFFKETDIYVNVITGPNKEPREMMFSTPKPGIWYVPSEGETVEVHNISGKLVARYPYDSPETFTLPEDITQGDVCFRLNENTQLYFSTQEDGTVNVDLSADGRLTINAKEGFDVLDGDGYGIVSETAAGTFSWHHEDVDFKTGPTATE